MPIAGDCRTVPFISCAHCRAALRLPGLQERRENVGPVRRSRHRALKREALGWAGLGWLGWAAQPGDRMWRGNR
jgi:hypothetical protein